MEHVRPRGIRVGMIAVAAVRIDRQHAMDARHRAACHTRPRNRRDAVRPRLVGAVVAIGFGVRNHVAGSHLTRLCRIRVRMCRRHVVHDLDDQAGTCRIAVRVGHLDRDTIENRICAAVGQRTMCQSVVGQRI